MTTLAGRCRTAVGALSLLSLLAPMAPARAAAGGAQCHAVVVSAVRWFCAALHADRPGLPRRLVVSTSTDNGRTWRAVDSQGIAVTDMSLLKQVLLGSDPATDPALYLHMNDGLYRSTDDGATFVPADRLAGATSGFLQLTPLPPEPNPPGLPDGFVARSRFGFAGQTSSSAILQPPLHQPVAGSPDLDQQFFVPPPGTGPYHDILLMALHVEPGANPPRSHAVLYACDARLTCAEQRYAFPVRNRYLGAVLAPDFRKSGVAYVWTTEQPSGDVTVWRTEDGGRTFTRWRAAEAITGPVNRAKPAGAVWDLSLAADPARPATLYARTSYIDRKGGPPGEQLFRSTDGGRRWTRIGYTGTVPWAFPSGAAVRPYSRAVVTAPGGRLLVIGAVDGYDGISCSVDGGRRWARACAR